MIEVIYKEEKKVAAGNEEFFRIPKNIRQIGETKGEHKIYIEDYANTFLEKLAADGRKEGKTAILLGRINWQEGISYVFIRGALLVENMDAAPEKVAFTDEIWTWIEEKQKQYFPAWDVVGWFFTMPDLPMAVSDSFQRAHLNYFGGNDKVFFMKDPTEQEESFFLYDNGHMAPQSGYYIYYEKNKEMQEYMISVFGEETVDGKGAAEDQAVASFRKIIASKKEKKEEEKEKKSPVFMYAASACLALTVMAVGVNFINNYQKMQDVTENVQQAAGTAQGTKAPSAEEDMLKGAGKEELKTDDSVTQKLQQENQEPEDQKSDTKEPEASPVQESAVTDPKDGENAQDKQENQALTKKKASEDKTPAPTQAVTEEPLPTETPAESEATMGNSVHDSYTIQYGDSLYKISTQRYGTMDMIPEICKLNGISSDDIIYPGQKILLP
ncbi:MAG: LysM peptidoglycan-binding domain-containing protein [Blautia sp.]|jgi:LysM repeat protein